MRVLQFIPPSPHPNLSHSQSDRPPPTRGLHPRCPLDARSFPPLLGPNVLPDPLPEQILTHDTPAEVSNGAENGDDCPHRKNNLIELQSFVHTHRLRVLSNASIPSPIHP